MLTNMIEVFDPCLYESILTIIFTPTLIIILFFTNLTWIKKNYFTLIRGNITKIAIRDFLKYVSWYSFIITLLITPLFFITIINLFGLLPYIFTLTTMTAFTLAVSLVLFISIIKNLIIFNFENFLIHLVPKSAPKSLIILLVFIELIRLIIRPLTLMLRLNANLIAGHLIVIIIRRALLPIIMRTIPVSIALFLINIIETGVSIIQALVITILLHLYAKDSIN